MTPDEERRLINAKLALHTQPLDESEFIAKWQALVSEYGWNAEMQVAIFINVLCNTPGFDMARFMSTTDNVAAAGGFGD